MTITVKDKKLIKPGTVWYVELTLSDDSVYTIEADLADKFVQTELVTGQNEDGTDIVEYQDTDKTKLQAAVDDILTAANAAYLPGEEILDQIAG